MLNFGIQTYTDKEHCEVILTSNLFLNRIMWFFFLHLCTDSCFQGINTTTRHLKFRLLCVVVLFATLLGLFMLYIPSARRRVNTFSITYKAVRWYTAPSRAFLSSVRLVSIVLLTFWGLSLHVPHTLRDGLEKKYNLWQQAGEETLA